MFDCGLVLLAQVPLKVDGVAKHHPRKKQLNSPAKKLLSSQTKEVDHFSQTSVSIPQKYTHKKKNFLWTG